MKSNPIIRSPRARRQMVVALAAATTVTLSACGTRLSDDRLAAGAGGTNGVIVEQGAAVAGGGPAAQPDDVVAAPGGSPVIAPGAVGPGVPKASSSGAGTGTAAKPAGAAARTPATRAATEPDAPCASTLAPVPLGQTLVTSGLIGAALVNLRTGLQMWAKDINARGGLQCHPVEVTSLDDGSDPARVTSNFTTLVNGKKVVAMMAIGTPVADTAAQSSAERLKVPVIGGDVLSPVWQKSPYLFPQGSSPVPTFAGGLKAAAGSKNAKHGGLLYCQEASICGLLYENWDYVASKAGVSKGIAKAVTITQPDYTAECQALKLDKVEAVYVAMDGSALRRLVRSCSALNYFPAYAISSLGVNADAASDPSLQKLDIWIGTANVPFPSTDTRGAKEFHAAVARFLPGQVLDQPMLSGWASGKLLEAALAKVSAEARSGPITSAMILKGLSLLKNETLDELAPPLNFPAGKPAPVVECYYGLAIKPGGFAAPLGGKRFCF